MQGDTAPALATVTSKIDSRTRFGTAAGVNFGERIAGMARALAQPTLTVVFSTEASNLRPTPGHAVAEVRKTWERAEDFKVIKGHLDNFFAQAPAV